MDLDAIKKGIMTPRAYSRLQHATPYCYTLSINGGTLGYFGAHHSNKPSDEMFAMLHAFYEVIKPEIVFVEGMSDPRVRLEVSRMIEKMSFTEAIVHGGEPLYAAKLAVEHGVPWECPEPSDGELYQELLQDGFMKHEIAAFNVLMVLPQWQRRDEVMSFKDYAQFFIEQFKRATKWTDDVYTYEAAMKTAERILGHPIDLQDVAKAERLVDPIPWPHYRTRQTVFNALAAAHSRIRDEYMIKVMLQPLLAKQRVLVVFGASHAVMQELALRALSDEK